MTVTGEMRLVITADFCEESWHSRVCNDPVKSRLPEKTLMALELKMNERFMDVIDLLNYSLERDSVNDPGKGLVSRDDAVTLNGLFLADYLKKHGYDVELVQNAASREEELKQLLKEEPFAVIISTTFFTLFTLKEIVLLIKRYCSGKTKIIIGGPAIYYAAVYYPEILKMYGPILADTFLIVEKQGEKSLVRLLDGLNANNGRNNMLPKDVRNVIKVDETGHFISSPPEEENNDINDHLIDWRGLPGRFLSRVTPYRTSLGCPYRCDFCTFWVLHPIPMYKTIECIANELQTISTKKEINHLLLTDDTLNISEKRIESICSAFIRCKSSIPWSAFLRTKPVTKRIANLLKEAGCRFVHIGFESFDNKILENMNKRETVDDHLRCIELLKEAGIGILGSFIFGYPGETEASIDNTVSMINRSGIDVSEIYGFIYYPYSPISKKKEKFRLNGEIYDWSHFSMNSKEFYETLLPGVVNRLETYGAFNWDNWGTVALFSSHGFAIPEIKEIFKIKNRLIRRQGAGKTRGGEFTDRTLQELSRLKEIGLKNRYSPG